MERFRCIGPIMARPISAYVQAVIGAHLNFNARERKEMTGHALGR